LPEQGWELSLKEWLKRDRFVFVVWWVVAASLAPIWRSAVGSPAPPHENVAFPEEVLPRGIAL
jgi:hypothetical protein